MTNNDRRLSSSSSSSEKQTDAPASMTTPVVTTTTNAAVVVSNRQRMLRLVQDWIQLSLTLDGRDKITKVLQYAVRWIASSISSSSASSSSWHSVRWKLLQTHLSQSRKAYRLGRSLVELDKLRQQLQKQNKSKNETITNGNTSLNVGLATLFGYRATTTTTTTTTATSSGRDHTTTATLVELATTLKTLGLLFFWAADNLNFLTYTGLLDNYQLREPQRIQERKKLQSKFSKFANQSYFVSALLGLLLNWRSYSQQQQRLANSSNCTTNNTENVSQANQKKRRDQKIAVIKVSRLASAATQKAGVLVLAQLNTSLLPLD